MSKLKILRRVYRTNTILSVQKLTLRLSSTSSSQLKKNLHQGNVQVVNDHGLRNVTAGINQATIFGHRQFNRDTVIWIVRTQQSFTVIETDLFREFVSYINSYAIR